MITVLGASGFVGSHLVRAARQQGLDCFAPARDQKLTGDLGDVIYCIGLTADFRKRPLDAIEAHVSRLSDVIATCRFDSLLYLSSTRVYLHSNGNPDEDDPLTVKLRDLGDLYSLSKLTGESMTLSCANKGRVARLSNVYGDDFKSDNFLSTVISDVVETGKVTLRTSRDSEKDYISVQNVTELLIRIATSGQSRIYNVASGRNIANYQVAERLIELTGCEIDFIPQAEKVAFPPLNVNRIQEEFDAHPSNLISDLPELIRLCMQSKGALI